VNLENEHNGDIIPTSDRGLTRVTSPLARRALALASDVERRGAIPLAETFPEKVVIDCGQGVGMEFMRVMPGNITLVWRRDFDLFVVREDPLEDEDDNGDIVGEEARRRLAAQPNRSIRIAHPFYIGRLPVTRAQWQAITSRRKKQWKNEGGGSDRAVTGVTWDKCQEVAALLSQKAGGEVTLPSEAQWMLAACMGASVGPADKQLHEWCYDAFSNDFGEIPDDGRPCMDGGGVVRVLRGGNSNSFAAGCSSRSRMGGWYDEFCADTPDHRSRREKLSHWFESQTEPVYDPFAGFRVVIDIPFTHETPSELVIECGAGVLMSFRLIAAGSFVRKPQKAGGAESYRGDKLHRSPIRVIGKPTVVQIQNPFYMGTYTVTCGQWRSIMGTLPAPARVFGPPRRNATEVRPSPDHPVGINQEPQEWAKIGEFCKRLSQRAGLKCRLPNEAEWEYACRAGSITRYCYGDDPKSLAEYAWYVANARGTQPVGLKKPNAWGLHDMHGNVWEWCADEYDDGYYPLTPENDPPALPGPRARGVRGGSWEDEPRRCRSSASLRHLRVDRSYSIGFRLVLVAP
jgi:formylglycine-generating enzyme required for sulfatase activity